MAVVIFAYIAVVAQQRVHMLQNLEFEAHTAIFMKSCEFWYIIPSTDVSE
jgi:hypothetical protein